MTSSSYTTLSNLEQNPANWQTAGAKANTGASGAASDQKMAAQPDGRMMFEVDPHQPYGDGFWYNRTSTHFPDSLAQQLAATRFVHGMKILVKAADLPNVRAIEFQIEQVVSGRLFNMAWQGFPGKTWRTFDFLAKEWMDLATPLPCEIKPDVETHLYYDAQRNGATGETIVDLVIDDVHHAVNVQHPMAPKAVRDSLSVAFQLDCQKGAYSKSGVWTPPPPARAYVKEMNFKFA